ncbi:MAG: hypothetical protein ABIV21_01685, partial [Pyrinomonadaceae bacterium]
MESRTTRMALQILIAIAAPLLLVSAATAQLDPDPNSPTPVLISLASSTEALAVPDKLAGRTDLSRVTVQAFRTGQKIRLFVKNITLPPGEGASAFRIDVEDVNGRRYRFPVVRIEPYTGYP